MNELIEIFPVSYDTTFSSKSERLIYGQNMKLLSLENKILLYDAGGKHIFVVSQDNSWHLLQTSSKRMLPAVIACSSHITQYIKPSLIAKNDCDI